MVGGCIEEKIREKATPVVLLLVLWSLEQEDTPHSFKSNAIFLLQYHQKCVSSGCPKYFVFRYAIVNIYMYLYNNKEYTQLCLFSCCHVHSRRKIGKMTNFTVLASTVSK